ncbi:hypothetical protein ACQZV8_17535 [Magnetococcales bacterium HHB-1]
MEHDTKRSSSKEGDSTHQEQRRELIKRISKAAILPAVLTAFNAKVSPASAS